MHCYKKNRRDKSNDSPTGRFLVAFPKFSMAMCLCVGRKFRRRLMTLVVLEYRRESGCGFQCHRHRYPGRADRVCHPEYSPRGQPRHNQSRGKSCDYAKHNPIPLVMPYPNIRGRRCFAPFIQIRRRFQNAGYHQRENKQRDSHFHKGKAARVGNIDGRNKHYPLLSQKSAQSRNRRCCSLCGSSAKNAAISGP